MARNTDTSKAFEKYMELTRLRREAYALDPRRCELCGNPLKYGSVARVKFCSQSCSAKVSNVKRGLKIHEITLCLVCGVVVPGAGATCSHLCNNELQRNRFIEKWLAGEIVDDKYKVSDHIRNHLFTKFGNACEKCTWGETNPQSGKIPLAVHHKNGIPNDNRPENLELLCPNCHSLTPNYGILNKGNGRPKSVRCRE